MNGLFKEQPGPRHHPRVTSPHSDILTSFPRDCPWPPPLPCLLGSPHLLDHVGGFVTAPQLLAVASIHAKSAVVPCQQPSSNYQKTLTLASSVQGLLGVFLDLGDRLVSHIVSDAYSIHGPASCPGGHVLCGWLLGIACTRCLIWAMQALWEASCVYWGLQPRGRHSSQLSVWKILQAWRTVLDCRSACL